MRITRIELSDFRAFPGPKVYKFDLGKNGKNMLLYGENGSGKSSLAYALSEFFNLDKKAERFLSFKNRYSGNEERSLVSGKILLWVDETEQFEWSYFSNRPTNNAFIYDAALRKAILDYRSLLRASLVEGTLETQLFFLAVEVLLRNTPVTLPAKSERTLGDYWDLVKLRKPKHRYSTMLGMAAAAANDFNAAFQAILPDIQREMQRFLIYFNDPWLQIQLQFPGISVDKKSKDYLGQMLQLIVKYRDLVLNNHVLFLNEARLSAIALALYFAAVKMSNPRSVEGVPSPLKILVLDDVLIGLDMTHRIPVLDILKAEFTPQDWQTFLFTFDHSWYEVAKQYLNDGKWVFCELHNIRIGNTEQPIVLSDNDHLERAISFLKKGEVKAAAVHVRTEFELVLKRACHALRLHVRYEIDQRKLPCSELWGALKTAQFEFQPHDVCNVDQKGQTHRRAPRKQVIRYISPTLAAKIERSVSWVLNPLSHSQSVDRYHSEIQAAVDAVGELRRVLDRAINASARELAVQRELCLRVLKGIGQLKSNEDLLGSGKRHMPDIVKY